jgi:hypothetical protein
MSAARRGGILQLLELKDNPMSDHSENLPQTRFHQLLLLLGIVTVVILLSYPEAFMFAEAGANFHRG